MTSRSDPDTTRLREAIEHTLLRPEASAAEVETLCAEALEHSLGGVCVNPTHVRRAASCLTGGTLRVVTVVGFPLGATFSVAKAKECALAVEAGADELDMVQDIGAACANDWTRVQTDIQMVVEAAGGRPVKVILETAKLDDVQKQRACEAAASAGAAFVKTCTGFGGGRATVHDIALMRRSIGACLGIKASGGIRTREQAIALLQAGATRIGTSVGPALLARI